MEELTFSAKSVELAVKEAAQALGVDQSKLKYQVIDEGKKALFSNKNAVIRIISSDKVARVKAFAEDIVKNFPLSEVSVDVREEEDGVFIDLSGEEASYLIGRRGDTLNSLQYLFGLVVNNGEEKYSRVILNINGYREKREATLQSLAKRLANQAIRTARSVTLEPMAPYERRIIHATVQKIEHVDSSSIGEEPNRRVVITPDNVRPYRSKKDFKHSSRREAPRQDNSQSLIKDDFLNSSSTIEGMKKEKELRDAALPLYSKIEL